MSCLCNRWSKAGWIFWSTRGMKYYTGNDIFKQTKKKEKSLTEIRQNGLPLVKKSPFLSLNANINRNLVHTSTLFYFKQNSTWSGFGHTCNLRNQILQLGVLWGEARLFKNKKQTNDLNSFWKFAMSLVHHCPSFVSHWLTNVPRCLQLSRERAPMHRLIHSYHAGTLVSLFWP